MLRRQVDGLRVEAVARARSEAALRKEIKRLEHRSVMTRDRSTQETTIMIFLPLWTCLSTVGSAFGLCLFQDNVFILDCVRVLESLLFHAGLFMARMSLFNRNLLWVFMTLLRCT